MWLLGLSVLIGIILGGLSAYLLATFEQKWYKYVTTLVGVASPSAFVVCIHRYYGASDVKLKQQSSFFILLSFVLSFLAVLFVLIHLIKTENNEDVGAIRTRDIILGRKDYIEAYYNARKNRLMKN